MSGKEEVCCWQCSEYAINFSYILNTINDLKRKRIASSAKNIFDRLNAGDVPNSITEECLEEILDYAVQSKYVSTAKYNKTLSYKVNDKEIEGRCTTCDETLTLYKPEEWIANKVVEYVDRETFESLAKEIFELKSNFQNLCDREKISDLQCMDEMHKLREQNEILMERLKHKNEQISFLLEKNRHLVAMSSSASNAYVSMETNPNIHNTERWHTVKDSRVNRHSSHTNQLNFIPLTNRFNGLPIDEVFSQNTNEQVQLDDVHELNRQNKNRTKYSDIKRRPQVVINEHCDNDILKRRDILKTYPGNSSYSNITRSGKKICLLGDSTINKLDILEFDGCVKKGTAIKRCFPGTTSKRLSYYVDEALKEEHPDVMIIHVGTNDLTKTTKSNEDIADDILNLVEACRKGGVNKIIVSSLLTRPRYNHRVEHINELLRENAEISNYIFIDNSNITTRYLWEDKLHPNYDGITILANNYLHVLNTRDGFDDWF